MLVIVMNDVSLKASIFQNTLIPTVKMNKASSNTCNFSYLFVVYFTTMSKPQTLKTAWPVGRSVDDDLEMIWKEEMVDNRGNISVVAEGSRKPRKLSVGTV